MNDTKNARRGIGTSLKAANRMHDDSQPVYEFASLTAIASAPDLDLRLQRLETMTREFGKKVYPRALFIGSLYPSPPPRYGYNLPAPEIATGSP
jgi:hypothetical protein